MENKTELLTCNHPETGELIIEEFRPVPEYEDRYHVSSFGRVKSFMLKGNMLKPVLSNGYPQINLRKNNTCWTIQIHVLVAIVFFGHKRCGYKIVVDHKNHIRSDNRYFNLRLVTQRENSNLKHLTHSSKYTGVSLTYSNTWAAKIVIGNKKKHLGTFKTELDAHNAYQEQLNKLTQ
jgi:hypothetical protein